MDSVLLKNILEKLNNKGFNEHMYCPHCQSSKLMRALNSTENINIATWLQL